MTRGAATVGLALISQSVYLVARAATDGYDAARHGELVRVLATCATVSAVFGLVHLVAPREGRTGFAMTFGVLAAFVLLSFARFETAGSFDFAFAYYDGGYRTLVASASDEPESERSDAFFRQIGFQETHWQDEAARGRGPLVWGAGLQDDALYRRFFAMLDARLDAPLFAVAINASNHARSLRRTRGSRPSSRSSREARAARRDRRARRRSQLSRGRARRSLQRDGCA